MNINDLNISPDINADIAHDNIYNCELLEKLDCGVIKVLILFSTTSGIRGWKALIYTLDKILLTLADDKISKLKTLDVTNINLDADDNSFDNAL